MNNLKLWLKALKSGKYKVSTNQGFLKSADNGARSFAGILCTTLKEKLKLKFEKLGDCIYIGAEQLFLALPTEVAVYFGVNRDEVLRIQSVPKKLYEFLKAANV